MTTTWQLGGAPLYDPHLQSRSVTHENRSGEKGRGGMAAAGRKGSACHGPFENATKFEMANIEGPGCIRHIWITTFPGEPLHDRNLILRFYWDDQDQPSVEAPLGDFFGLAHGRRRHFLAEFTGMPEGRGFNCHWPMPFAKRCRIEVENDIGEDCPMFFYQVDYTIGDEVTPDTPYFHVQFRRTLETVMKQDYAILDGVQGKGRFLGCNVGIIPSAPSPPFWWGEGEVKMYLDGDTDSDELRRLVEAGQLPQRHRHGRAAPREAGAEAQPRGAGQVVLRTRSRHVRKCQTWRMPCWTARMQ